MATRNQNPVGTVFERFKHERWVYSSTAHDPDDPYVRRVLNSANASKIGTSIAAPIA
jgi:hypothetical protein